MPPDPVLDAVAKLVTPLSPVWSGRPSELQARLPDAAMLSHVLTRYLNVNAERRNRDLWKNIRCKQI